MPSDEEFSEKEQAILDASKQAIAKLREYGIFTEQKEPIDNSSMQLPSIYFSIPEFSTIDDKVGDYKMDVQEDMIKCFKKVFLRGLMNFNKERNMNLKSDYIYNEMETHTKFYCRIRKGEIWDHRHMMKERFQNNMKGA